MDSTGLFCEVAGGGDGSSLMRVEQESAAPFWEMGDAPAKKENVQRIDLVAETVCQQR